MTRHSLMDRRWPRIAAWLVTLACTGALGFSALTSTGCGGGNSCQACRDDCAKNGIPASQCNCANCKVP